jgi:hypothetical protein
VTGVQTCALPICPLSLLIQVRVRVRVRVLSTITSQLSPPRHHFYICGLQKSAFARKTYVTLLARNSHDAIKA